MRSGRNQSSCYGYLGVLIIAAVSFTSLVLIRISCPRAASERLASKPQKDIPAAAYDELASEEQKDTHPDLHTRIEYFRDVASSMEIVTDKVGGGGGPKVDLHAYHNMYGTFLLPYAAHTPDMKFLEIGLGCIIGPGASVALWKKLFPKAELWEAEYDTECVQNYQERGELEGVHVLMGDQADEATLDRWIETSGGNFDIVVDDGGHTNCRISNSFDKLWPQVKPGGLYFIEDMHVGKHPSFISDTCNKVVMSQRVKDWAEQLIYKTMGHFADFKHEIPPDVLFLHCQAEACVVGKKKGPVNDPIKINRNN